VTLDAARIAAALGTVRYGRSLEVKARTGSTNDDARAAIDAGAPSGHVIVADAQDRGRGAQGRSWSSPGGTDLYFSIVDRRTLGPVALPWLTLAVGLGVRDALAGFAPAQLKWPNDVLLGAEGRKAAGILVESSSTGTTIGPFVIGVGLDVNRDAFAPELDGIATSLRRETGEVHDRSLLLAAVLGTIEARTTELSRPGGPAALHDALDAHLAWRGERVRIDEHAGELVGVAADGALRLGTSGGELRLRTGTLRRA
jgi:BirA family biotin operon repressor/biotin-[acetyl-CoA-carboxylase] ligase